MTTTLSRINRNADAAMLRRIFDSAFKRAIACAAIDGVSTGGHPAPTAESLPFFKPRFVAKCLLSASKNFRPGAALEARALALQITDSLALLPARRR